MDTMVKHPNMERVNTWLRIYHQQVGYAGNTHCLTTVEELKGKDVSLVYYWFGDFVSKVADGITSYKNLLDGDFMLARMMTDTILDTLTNRLFMVAYYEGTEEAKLAQHKLNLLSAIFDCNFRGWFVSNKGSLTDINYIKALDNFVFGMVIRKLNQFNCER